MQEYNNHLPPFTPPPPPMGGGGGGGDNISLGYILSVGQYNLGYIVRGDIISSNTVIPIEVNSVLACKISLCYDYNDPKLYACMARDFVYMHIHYYLKFVLVPLCPFLYTEQVRIQSLCECLILEGCFLVEVEHVRRLIRQLQGMGKWQTPLQAPDCT